MKHSIKHLMLLGALAVMGATPALAQDATQPDTGVITAPGTPDGRPVGQIRERVREAVRTTAEEVKAWHAEHPGEPLPDELKAKLEKGSESRTKMHSIREGREDRRDTREDVRDEKYQGGKRDMREDRRDLRDDKRDGRRDGRFDRRDGRRGGGFNN
jgi:hypothetical protein